MGTYTTNYQLYMPTVGEQGWGELVNGNFSTIDTTMKNLSNAIGTLEIGINTVEERVTILETGDFETINAGTIEGDTVKITKLIVPFNANGKELVRGSVVTKDILTGSATGTWCGDLIVTLPTSGYPQWLYIANAKCTITATNKSSFGTDVNNGIRILDSKGNVLATKTQNIGNPVAAVSCSTEVDPYETYTIQGFNAYNYTQNGYKFTLSCTGLYLIA